jgi:hypothetical protein
VEVKNPAGVVKKLKGYIVATQLRNQAHNAKYRSKIFAEDPFSAGEVQLTIEEAETLRTPIIAGHYAGTFDRLGLPLQAAALRGGFIVPSGGRRRIGVWESLLPSLAKRMLVGVVYPSAAFSILTPIYVPIEPPGVAGPPFFDANPHSQTGTFFGLDRQLFNVLQSATAHGLGGLANVTELAVPEVPAGMSFLRDGTLIAPQGFMVLREVIAV